MKDAIDLKQLVEEVKELAHEVGRRQLAKFRTQSFKISSKQHDIDLVTEVDKESEAAIIQFVQNRFIDHSLLCEESGEHQKNSPWCWVVDPLDGTVNFARGLPIFAISIALQYYGETVLGVVHAPKLNETFYAIRNQGSYLNGQKLQVSLPKSWSKAVLATGFPYDKHLHPLNNLDNVKQITPKIGGLRRMGAAAYDLCCVAAGFLDGYWELCLKPWDIAAGQLIVEEAQGEVVEFCPERKISIIAGHGETVNFIKSQFQSVDRE